MKYLKLKTLLFGSVLSAMMALAGCSAEFPDGAVIDESLYESQDLSSDEVLSDKRYESAEETFVVLPDGTEFFVSSDTEEAYCTVNGNIPYFDNAEKSSTEPFEFYSDLDGLGRCGMAYANICLELMPTEERGEIGSVRPSGWHTVKYNGIVQGNYLYNRCHLIGFQLAGENANERNLITGTRYLNIEGMLPYENMIDDYVEDTGNHVLYRVTPLYSGDDLVARGVLMEGWSVEDSGEGICFNIFAYNVQPGIGIDYKTGESWEVGKDEAVLGEDTYDYILNTNSGKFHMSGCQYADSISDKNRIEMTQTLQAMLDAGYTPCGSCRPDELSE